MVCFWLLRNGLIEQWEKVTPSATTERQNNFRISFSTVHGVFTKVQNNDVDTGWNLNFFVRIHIVTNTYFKSQSLRQANSSVAADASPFLYRAIGY